MLLKNEKQSSQQRNDNRSAKNYQSKEQRKSSRSHKEDHQSKRENKDTKTDLCKVNKHFENPFTDPEAEGITKEPTNFFRLVIKSEVREAVKKLSNNKTPGQDEVTSEDLKKYDPLTVTKTRNAQRKKREAHELLHGTNSQTRQRQNQTG